MLYFILYKRRQFRLLALILGVTLLFIIARALKAEEPKTTLPSPPKPGTFTLAIKSSGEDRSAYVHIPKNYDPAKQYPLVLALHGGGGDGSNMIKNNGIAGKADASDFILVCPNGLPAIPSMKGNFMANPPMWNSGQLPSRSPRSKIDDVKFIADLLDLLKNKVSYDEKRVYCTGHSNGGGMTFKLANELSDRFAAIATVAGQVAIEKPAPESPMPTLYIYGMLDPLLPANGGESKLPWGTRQTEPVISYIEKWAKGLGCELTPLTISDTNGVKTVRYPSAQNKSDMTVIYIAGQGHEWPGGKSPLPERTLGPKSNKLNATDTIWNFFQDKSR